MNSRASGRFGRTALFAVGAVAALGAGASTLSADSKWTIEIEVAGTYASGIFAQGGAEIVRYDAATKRVFAVNAKEASVDVLVHYAGWTDKLQPVLGGINPVAAPFLSFSVPEPTGVVGVVAPDEPPLLGLIAELAPALAAGKSG